MSLIIPSSQTLASDGYDIDNSCRFDGTSAYLSKTFGAAGNNKKYTVAFWCKRAKIGSYQNIFSPYPGGGNLQISWDASSGDKIEFYYHSGGYVWNIVTTQVFRDPSAWYHIVIAFDSTQVTNTNRIKIFVNGTQVTEFGTATYPAQDISGILLDSTPLQIGAKNGADFFGGYLAEVHVLDGTAVSNADDFGERGDYGEWKPKAYSGSHGTNGFYLDFSNASALGDDAAGSNDLTVSGVASHDQMLDTPTNNFAVANPLTGCLATSSHGGGGTGADITSMSEGNLQFVMNPSPHFYGWADSSIGMSSGKWYCEVHFAVGGTNAFLGGIVGNVYNLGDPYNVRNYIGGAYDGYSWQKSYGVLNDTTADAYGGITPANGDVLGIALDLENNKLYFHQNGTYLASGDPAANSNGFSINAASTTRSGNYYFAWGSYGEGHTFTCNYGQDGTFAGLVTAGDNADDNDIGNFKYDVPAGFLALCTKNLPDCAVVPAENFSVKLYDDGAGAKTGVGFQPDLVWLKSRGSVYHNKIVDSVRGVQKALEVSNVSAELTESTGLTAFGADGFTVGADTDYSDTTGDGMVAWCWKAGTAGSGATQGSGTLKTYTSSYNTAAGFSITKYTGNGSSDHKIPHSLSVAPNLVITKNLTDAGWTRGYCVGAIRKTAHDGTIDMDFTDYLIMNTTAAVADSASGVWNDIAPTATVFNCGDHGSFNYTNENAGSYIAYCWHSVEGYSKIGSYRGNSVASGAFIHCGFKPAYIMIKVMNNGSERWNVHDSARSPSNVSDGLFRVNEAEVEQTASWTYIDFLSNGFKIRATGSDMNNSSYFYLYWAFAETPLKFANAR